MCLPVDEPVLLLMYCNTSHDWPTYRAKYTPDVLRSLGNQDSGQTLYVDTRWVVLYGSEEEKVPVARVQDCLRTLNLVYSGQNDSDLSKVPVNAPTPWAAVLGNPRMQFLPLDASTLKVEYRAVNAALDSNSPVLDAATQGGRVPGVLNIYIGSSGKGSILGQAEIGSNIVYAMYATIGGYQVPGTLPSYDQGKTVVHEVGHALGLVHTFSDSVCDHASPYTDVPEQIRPNFDTALSESTPGVWVQTGDNRYKDRQNGTALSCLHIQAQPNTAPNEMGVNFMDYGDDRVSLMFSANQVNMMRDYLQSAENTTLTLKAATDTSMSAGGTGAAATAVVTSPVSLGAATSTDDGLSTTAIVLIAVFGGLAVLLLIWFVVHRMRRPQLPATVKRAEAYHVEPSSRMSLQDLI